MTKKLYAQPEVLATCTYSTSMLLAETDGWSRVDLHEHTVAEVRRSLAAGEVADAIETATDVLDRPIADVAIVIRTGDVPDVFVREAEPPVRSSPPSAPAPPPARRPPPPPRRV